jgi:hypothetical protein
MVIGLNGYTIATFDANAQGAFVAGVAVLGGFEATTIEVVAVTNSDSVRRRSLLQTVGKLVHAVPPPGGGREEWSPTFFVTHSS